MGPAISSDRTVRYNRVAWEQRRRYDCPQRLQRKQFDFDARQAKTDPRPQSDRGGADQLTSAPRGPGTRPAPRTPRPIRSCAWRASPRSTRPRVSPGAGGQHDVDWAEGVTGERHAPGGTGHPEGDRHGAHLRAGKSGLAEDSLQHAGVEDALQRGALAVTRTLHSSVPHVGWPLPKPMLRRLT